jgi:hypothetical protein
MKKITVEKTGYKKVHLPQHAQQRLILVSCYRVSNESKGLPPHHLQEGFGIKGWQITPLRLPSPVEIVAIWSPIPGTILRLRDDRTILVCVQRRRIILDPRSCEQIARFLCTQQASKQRTHILEEEEQFPDFKPLKADASGTALSLIRSLFLDMA